MLEAIKEVLKQYTEVDENVITLDSNLQNDLGLNSLDVVNIVVEFEELFNVEINDEDIRTLITVRDIEEYLSKLNVNI